MNYCMNCGAKLTENAKFCMVCGSKVGETSSADPAVPASADPEAPVREVIYPTGSPAPAVPASTPGVPAGGKKMFRWGVLIAILAAVLVLGGAAFWVFTSGVLEPAPERFVRMHRQLIDPVLDGVCEAVTVDRKDLSKDLKIEPYLDTDLTITAEIETGNSETDKMIRDSSVTMRMKTEEGEPGLFGFTLNLKGSDILNGTLVFDPDYIGVYLPELDDEYYRIQYSDLEKILEDAGVEFDLKDLTGNLNAGKSPLSIDEKELRGIFDEYLDVFFSMVNKNNTKASKETLSLPATGEQVKCTVLTFHPSAKEVTDMARELLEKFADDDRIRKMVRSALEYSYSFDPSNSYWYSDADEYVDEMMEEYDKAVNNLWQDNRDAIEEFAEQVEEKNICWKIAYKNDRIHWICLMDEEGNGLGYESAGNVVQERQDVLTEYQKGKAKKLVESAVKLSGKSAEGTLRIYRLDSGDMRITYSIDLLNRSGLQIPYSELRVRYGDLDIRLKVGKEGKGSQHDLEMKIDGDTVKIGIYSSDTKSTVKAPKGSGTRVTIDNYEDIIEEMSDKIYELLYNIAG